LGIDFPRPNVQFEKARQAVTIRRSVRPCGRRTVDVLHQVTLHLWSSTGRKGTREYDELDANQLHFAIRLRLIDQGLRFRGIKLSILQQSFPIKLTIDVVDAHRTVVGAAYAAEGRAITFGWDGLVVLCGVANNLDELVLVPLSLWLRLLLWKCDNFFMFGFSLR